MATEQACKINQFIPCDHPQILQSEIGKQPPTSRLSLPPVASFMINESASFRTLVA